MPIGLPKKPDGSQYEDFLSASLRTLGYFVETRLVLRSEKKEVLELDVVASPSSETPEQRILFEAKKNGFNFPNVFKLYGQRMFLDIDAACLVSLKGADPAHHKILAETAENMSVRLCNYGIDLEGYDSLAPTCTALDSKTRDALLGSAWCQQIAHRLSYAGFVKRCKENSDDPLFEEARQYDRRVHSSFFRGSALERAEELYQAYFDSPQLVRKLVSQKAESEGCAESVVWDQVSNTNAHLWIQYLMATSNLAKIRIIKNALDHVSEHGNAPLPSRELYLGGVKIDLPNHLLTPRFRAGLQLIREHPHANRLPFLYQLFVDNFGGFLRYEDAADLNLLAVTTGVPADDVVDALKLLDHFFSAPDSSCFYPMPSVGLLCMKLIPGFIRGAGCFLRKDAFGLSEYNEWIPESSWLLGPWHNALYHSLVPELEKEAE